MIKADLKNVNYFKVHTGIRLLIETAILKYYMSGLAQGCQVSQSYNNIQSKLSQLTLVSLCMLQLCDMGVVT